MNLRKHQREVNDVITGIIAGSGVRTIVVHATPGAGKSSLPIIAGRLITAGLADRLAWICPRQSLQDQGERNFMDPFFRRMLGHDLLIRASTNQENPSRGLAGWISTYQALAVDDRKTALRDFGRHRYILVLDEFHHLAADGEWTGPIAELVERAAFVVMMTGTLARGDEKRIAFLNYRPDPFGDKGDFCPAFGESEGEVFVRYTRRDALAERAILPLEFHFADGVASWRKESGKEITAKLSTGRADANQALYTALKTEYAQELLTAGVQHWRYSPGSLLVVAASIESAKEYTALLKRQGLHAEIATSDDTPQAVKAIKALKGGKLRILVTVAMAYEGLDVPSISHIICLTNVRSMPWIEQMVARAVRIDPQAGPYETQRGHIFAPADRMFTELAAKIQSDQTVAIARPKAQAGELANGSLFEGEGGGGCRPGITPLSSRLINGQGDLFLGTAPYQETHFERVFHEAKTQREQEKDLRDEIKRRVNAYARLYCLNPATLNNELLRKFGKNRDNMTLPELERVRCYLKANYQVPQRREPGVVLVPVGRGR